MPVHVDLSTKNDVKDAEGWRVRSIRIALRINLDFQKRSSMCDPSAEAVETKPTPEVCWPASPDYLWES